MTLDQQSATVVAAIEARFPDLGGSVVDATVAREILASNPPPSPPPIDMHSVEDLAIDGPAGQIRLRVFRSRLTDPGSAVIVFFHGGGWTICGLDTHDNLCRQMAEATDAVVVSVDYRMAPENRYPAAIDDATAATMWVSENADRLGVARDKIVVAGDSAGGNLAAVVAQRALRGEAPPIALQFLIYPMLDHRFDTRSYRDNAEGFAVTKRHLQWYWEQYLGDSDGSAPDASPLRARDLAGLAPAYIVTAEHCPLLSENEAYAALLEENGVPVTLDFRRGTFHGFFQLRHVLDVAEAASAQAFAHIREHFGDAETT